MPDLAWELPQLIAYFSVVAGIIASLCLVICLVLLRREQGLRLRERTQSRQASDLALRKLTSSVTACRAMLDSTSMVVLVFERDSASLLFANRQALELFGCNSTETLSDQVFSRPDAWGDGKFSLRDFERWLEETRQLGVHRREWLFSGADRRDVWVDCALGNTVFEGCCARILTGHNIHRYKTELVGDQLRRKVLTGINNGTPLELILDSLCELAEARFPDSHCQISLFDEQQDALVSMGNTPFARAFREKMPRIAAGYGETSLGTSAHTRSRVISASLSNDHRWQGCRSLIEDLNIGSAWSEPVTGQNGELLAILTMFSAVSRQPSDEMIDALTSTVSLASLAIEREGWRTNLEASASSERFIRQIGVDLVSVPVGEAYARELQQILHRVLAQYELGNIAVWEVSAPGDELVLVSSTCRDGDAGVCDGKAARVRTADVLDSVTSMKPEYLVPKDLAYDWLRMNAGALKPVLVVPVYSSSEGSALVGLLVAQSRFFYINQTNIEHLEVLGSLIRTSLVNRRLVETLSYSVVDEREAREKLETELQVARAIQMSMVPGNGVFKESYKHWSIEAWLKPARAVGGDLYEFIRLPNGKVLLAVGDVSDKGAPAALFMARTVSLLNYLARSRDGDLIAIASELNAELCRANDACMFVTMIMVVLDLSRGEMEWLNAGHNMPMQTSCIEAPKFWAGESGPPLGLYEGVTFCTEHVMTPPGSSVTLYSDGVTEAFNEDGAEFGDARLLNLGYRGSRQGEGFIRYLREQLLQFTDKAPQSDDITLMTIQHYGH